MSSSAILNLPREIQDEILSYISRHTDLKALCLVSKKISAISTLRLYRDLILRYDYKYLDRLSHCLTLLSHSRSLEHVKTIKVGYMGYFPYFDDVEDSRQDYCNALGHLLPKLQDNSLNRFESDEFTCPTHEQLEFLWQHQKGLRILQLNFGHYSPTKSDLANPTHSLRSLKAISELNLNLGSEAVDSVVRPLLEILDLSHLQKLTLSSKWLVLQQLRFSDYFPVTLTHLTFRDVTFIDNNLQLDNYPSLRHLTLHWCFRSQSIFAGYSRPTLKSLSFAERSRMTPSNHALADMLRRFQGLESLAIYIGVRVENPESVQFLIDTIDRHKDTLKSFLLHHGWRNVQHALFDAELNDVIKKCKNLSQLGLSLDTSKMVDVCKGLLEELQSLVTLIVYFRSSKVEWRAEKYLEYGAKITNQVMRQISASSKLSLLAFQRTNHCPMSELHVLDVQPHCYLRLQNLQESSAQSGSGDVEEMAIPMDAQMAKYCVSECDLMDSSRDLTMDHVLKHPVGFHLFT